MKIIEYLRKYKKLIIAVICIVILTVTAKTLFDNYALADVKVTTASQQGGSSTIKIYASTDTKTIDLGGPGLKFIPRKTKSLIATKDESASSQVKVTLPWYGYLEKTITLTPSKNADKIAYLNTNRNACATYSVRLASLLAYDCVKPVSLSHYDTSAKAWTTKRLATLPFEDGLVAPYMGGVIGIEGGQHVVKRPILAIRDDDTKVRFDLPEQMSTGDVTRAKIFTNTFSTSDGRFVIVDDSGNIYLGVPSPQNKSIAYKVLPSPAGYSSAYQRTLCQITGDFVYCYRGQALRGDLPPSSVKLPQESIITASFVNDQTNDTALETPGRYSDFYVTLDGDMYGKNFKKIFYLSQSGTTYKAKELAQNVDAAASGEGLLYIQKNAIYQVKKDADASMLFYSRNVLPKSLYISEGSTYIIGNVKDMENDFHAYKLNDQDYAGENRLIDLLPAGEGKLPAVTYQNLVGNRALFTLAIPITKTAREDINRADFEAKKERVTNALRDHGVDLTKLDTTFNY